MRPAWISFYFADYLADTGTLTLAQHGAYLLLMAHYYTTGKPIPAKTEIVHRICRCADEIERSAAEDILVQFFVRDGDVYRHKRVELELARCAERGEKRREAGRKGGLAKASNASDLLDHFLEQKATSHNHSHNHNHNQTQEVFPPIVPRSQGTAAAATAGSIPPNSRNRALTRVTEAKEKLDAAPAAHLLSDEDRWDIAAEQMGYDPDEIRAIRGKPPKGKPPRRAIA